jgi:hypothetical protein
MDPPPLRCQRRASCTASPATSSTADYISAETARARRFEQLTEETIHFVEELERNGLTTLAAGAWRSECSGSNGQA